MSIDANAIRTSLDQLGAALSAGDAAGVASFWDVPALVLADQGARAVTSREEVEAFFRESIAFYRQQGTPTAKPELDGWQPLGERLVAVDVTWLALDGAGAERGREASHYVMRVCDDGVPRIHVAMSRGVTGG